MMKMMKKYAGPQGSKAFKELGKKPELRTADKDPQEPDAGKEEKNAEVQATNATPHSNQGGRRRRKTRKSKKASRRRRTTRRR